MIFFGEVKEGRGGEGLIIVKDPENEETLLQKRCFPECFFLFYFNKYFTLLFPGMLLTKEQEKLFLCHAKVRNISLKTNFCTFSVCWGNIFS